jgi:hypothetical protein
LSSKVLYDVTAKEHQLYKSCEEKARHGCPEWWAQELKDILMPKFSISLPAILSPSRVVTCLEKRSYRQVLSQRPL